MFGYILLLLCTLLSAFVNLYTECNKIRSYYEVGTKIECYGLHVKSPYRRLEHVWDRLNFSWRRIPAQCINHKNNNNNNKKILPNTYTFKRICCNHPDYNNRLQKLCEKILLLQYIQSVHHSYHWIVTDRS